ncbi:MAG: hypothetical protein IJA09_06695 [Bacteroidales bacterium]|nr:hypothetical protein [Bacteroidales bacterium]
MQNVFDAQQEVNNNLNRNPFDLTHTNNLSLRFGYLYPIFTKIVPANTKFDINAEVGMQFMPMSFPVQTPIKARLSFFKVPLRTLWNGYMDYVGNFRDGLEEPYHDIPDRYFEDFYGECKLGDYLDIPNVIYNDENNGAVQLTIPEQAKNLFDFYYPLNPSGLYSPNYNSGFPITSSSSYIPDDYIEDSELNFFNGIAYNVGGSKFVANVPYSIDLTNLKQVRYVFPINYQAESAITAEPYIYFLDSEGTLLHKISFKSMYTLYESGIQNIQTTKYMFIRSEDVDEKFTFTLPNTFKTASIDKVLIGFYTSLESRFVTRYGDADFYSSVLMPDIQAMSSSVAPNFEWSTTLNSLVPGAYGTYRVITPETSPYYSSDSNPNGQKLTNYPARAYEAIYNAYYRDPRNNPLLDIYNKPVYNEWLLNKDGGADRTVYKLHRANWEKDFLTTAVSSPQQGIAPLVGLTQYVTTNPQGELTYDLSLVDEDGTKYKVSYNFVDNDGVKSYNISVGDKLPSDTKVLSLHSKDIIDSVNYGISIPDFRIVNSYQKYLELNIRKGYSYKDIIEGRFDCKVRFDELQMPEFIGGFTRNVSMNRILQSVDNNVSLDSDQRTYERSLGSLSGDAYLSTEKTPDINVFCDEECVIMGILSVIPTPAYSQLLPKHYLFRDILDHFQPEFNNIGMQPISYAEVCPLQAASFGVSLTDTFGYQRAWYDYISQPDTVHGLLRSKYRDFIMNRNFVHVPRLNEDFLLVDENQLNDVFQVQTDEDKIISQVSLKITNVTPINRVQIPRID